MPSTPFDTAHQDSLRTLIGKVLPDAGVQPIAEAVAAGYGCRTHDALLEAVRAVEAGGPVPVHDFDADQLIARLQELGERVGAQDEALRFLLRVMVDGPRSGAPPKQTASDETLARHYLRTGRLYIEVGLWEDAGSLLGIAMSVAPINLKAEVATALERAAPHAETAATNLALALLFADGLARDVPRAGALLEPLTRAQSREVRGIAHNWLGHIASGRLGGSPAPPAVLPHFEQAARLGHAEAAFNAGLMHEQGKGVPPSQDKARDLYRRGAELGHVASMTNLACKIMEQDPEEAIALLEQAAAAGDDKAAGLLDAWTETGMAAAAESGLDLEEDDPPPPLVRVVPSGAWRPKAIVAALRDGAGASSTEAEGIAAFMFGFSSWRELVRAATKGKADPPDEACDAAEVRRRRTYQAYVLAECSDMGPEAASIAIEALRPTAKAGRPVLDRDTQARMRAASQAYAEIWGDEELDDEGDLDSLEDLDAADVAAAVGIIMEAAGIDSKGDPLSMLDELRRMGPIQPEVWLGLMEERLGWVFAEVDEDAEEDGDQVAVAVGSGGQRVPVIMSAMACIPGEPGDKQVARLKADIGAAHPAGAVLIFNRPAGWLPEQGGGGLVYGGLLWSDSTWSDFVLRLGGGLDDALAQRGRDLAHPDARTVKELGFAEAPGVLHSLAAYLAGLKPDEADVQFLHSANGWALPMASPV